MNGDLQHRVALVTGAARGIGRAVALELAKRGADIVLNDWSAVQEAESVAAGIRGLGRRCLVQIADVSDTNARQQMFDDAIAMFGRLDILVNNAAWNIRKPFMELSTDDVERTWSVSQAAVFHCSQLAARQMVWQGGGSIVMISSVHGWRPYPNAAAYNAAKAAVNHLATSIALELAPGGVRVNVVEPGWIDTPGERQHNAEEELVSGAERLPMGRLGSPAEVAKAVGFLCSEDASYITGATLRVDGGFALKF